jgi:hypothetical protein
MSSRFLSVADSLQVQIKRLEKKLKAIAEKEFPRAAVSALNKIVKPASNDVAKTVAARQKLPVKVVRQQVSIRKATFRDPSALVRSYTRGISVARLVSAATLVKRMGTGTNKTGVTARGKTYKSAFINRTRRNQKVFVFERLGKSRFPLDVVRVPIDEALNDTQLKTVQSRYKNNFQKLYLHELNYRLSKYAK